jgi:hypothetical protein
MDRKLSTFTEVYLGHADIADFPEIARCELGTENPQAPDSSPSREDDTHRLLSTIVKR